MSDASTRRRPRALLNHHATLLLDDGRHGPDVRLIDISETGARIATGGMPSGEIVRVLWSPCTGVPPMTLQGSPVWRDEKFCGLEFAELEPKVRAVVRALIHYHRPD